MIELSAEIAGAEIKWSGSRKEEKGLITLNNKTVSKVYVNQEFLRPIESENYMTNYSKEKRKLGWDPDIKVHRNNKACD